MAYEPTNWKAGDVVTSAKLNKLERAVAAGGALVVYVDRDADTETGTVSYIINDDITAGIIFAAAPLVCFAITGMPGTEEFETTYEWLAQASDDGTGEDFRFCTEHIVFTAQGASTVPVGAERN